MFGWLFKRYSEDDAQMDIDTIEIVEAQDLQKIEGHNVELATNLFNEGSAAVSRLFRHGYYRNFEDGTWEKR